MERITVIYSGSANPEIVGLKDALMGNDNATAIDLDKNDASAVYKGLLESAFEIEAVVILIPTHPLISVEFLRRLRSNSDCKILLYHSDVPEYFLNYFLDLAIEADFVFVDDPEEIKIYQYYGVRCDFLYAGVPEVDVIANIKNFESRQYDVAFIGRISDRFSRSVLVNELEKSGLSVFIGGSGSKVGYISREEYFRILSDSKVVLNLTGVSTGAPWYAEPIPFRNRLQRIKARMYEGMAMGSIPLTENLASLSEQIKFNYFSFDNRIDLVKKLNHILFELDQSVILEIIASNRAIACEKFSCSFAAKTIIDKVSQISPQRTEGLVAGVSLQHKGFVGSLALSHLIDKKRIKEFLFFVRINGLGLKAFSWVFYKLLLAFCYKAMRMVSER